MVKDVVDTIKLCIGLIGIVSIVIISIILINFNNNSIDKATHNMKYDINYDKLTCEVQVDSTQYLDGYIITLDDYKKIKKKQAKEEIDNVKVLLGDQLYKDMTDGLDSDYFAGFCQNEYNKVYNMLQRLFSDTTAIEKLYKETKIKEPAKECSNDSCNIIEYINKYSKGTVKELLLESHMKYEALISKQKLTDEQKEQVEDITETYYAKDLCENKDYIDSLKVRVRITPYKEYKSNSKTKNYNEVIITDKSSAILNYITLYKCYNFYDDALGLTNYRDKLAVENGKKKLKRISTFYLCGLNDKDKFRLEYEVIDCKHNVKQSSEHMNELRKKAEIHLKEINLMKKIEEIKEKNSDYDISIEDFINKTGMKPIDEENSETEENNGNTNK